MKTFFLTALAMFILSVHLSAQTNLFPLLSSGSGNVHLTLTAPSGMVNVQHHSADPNNCATYDFDNGKNAYWGESSDAGNYIFRGRSLLVQENQFSVESGTASLGELWGSGYRLSINFANPTDAINMHYGSHPGFVRFHSNSLAASNYDPIVQSGDAGIVYGGASAGNPGFGFVITPWNNSSAAGLRVDPLGNVGINCFDTKSYQLAVNGNAVCNEMVVKATANWPDYVFHETYRVPTLKEIEQYIRANKHLPEMPTADSIRSNGLDLGANQTLLVKKIEELTLYSIDQDKRIQSLETELEELKSLIKAQRKTK